jgi:hypothetical protein
MISKMFERTVDKPIDPHIFRTVGPVTHSRPTLAIQVNLELPKAGSYVGGFELEDHHDVFPGTCMLLVFEEHKRRLANRRTTSRFRDLPRRAATLAHATRASTAAGQEASPVCAGHANDDSSDAICRFTGNPPYSFPPYSSRYAAAHRSRCGRGEALIVGMALA